MSISLGHSTTSAGHTLTLLSIGAAITSLVVKKYFEVIRRGISTYCAGGCVDKPDSSRTPQNCCLLM